MVFKSEFNYKVSRNPSLIELLNINTKLSVIDIEYHIHQHPQIKYTDTVYSKSNSSVMDTNTQIYGTCMLTYIMNFMY
jgi:hypothetical protein